MSTQTVYPRAPLWRGIPTQELSNQPTTQLWPVLPRFHVGLTQTTWNGESFLPFHWTSCTCQDLEHWGYLTIYKTHSSREICDWYRINSHLLGVGGWPVRKTIQGLLFLQTSMRVNGSKCLGLTLPGSASALHFGAFSKGMDCFEVFGLPVHSQCSTEENTGLCALWS